MSTISEMHYQIDLELNKINSNFYDIILPQEKDYWLNKAQERFVKDRYGAQSNPKGKGFEMSQKRIDDLRNLLVPNYYDLAYLLPQSNFDFNRKLTFFLPNDYWFLTSQRSKVLDAGCKNLNLVNNTKTVNYYVIPTTNSLPYSTFFIKNDVNISLISNLDYSKEDRNLFLLDLITQWNTNWSEFYGWTFYLDNYYDISSPNNIIAVVNKTDYLPLTSGFGEESNEFVVTPKEYGYYTAPGSTELVVTNKFAQQDDVYAMLNDPFNNTNPYGPLAIIHDNNIDVFINKNKFVVKEIAISYIRKPKLMSLSLNQSCELAEHTHAEILRDAVNLMLEAIEADKRLSTSLGVEQTNE
jgi:hypothetical protein